MTESPPLLVTHTSVPSEEMAYGPLNPYLGPLISFTRAPAAAFS